MDIFEGIKDTLWVLFVSCHCCFQKPKANQVETFWFEPAWCTTLHLLGAPQVNRFQTSFKRDCLLLSETQKHTNRIKLKKQ